jgi:hypothetical protein
MIRGRIVKRSSTVIVFAFLMKCERRRLQGCDQLIDRRINQRKKWLGIKTNPEDQDQQRHQHDPFSPGSVLQYLVFRLVTGPRNTLKTSTAGKPPPE